MKKSVKIMFLLVICMMLLLQACSSKSSNSGKEPAVSSNLTEPGAYPIVKNKENLKVLVLSSPRVENYDTNTFTKFMEEKTNLHVEFEFVPEAGKDAKLNLVLSSGEYPDIILNFNINEAQQIVYGEQGVFLPLNDYIEKYGVNTKQLFKDSPVIKDAITAPNGKIYSLPRGGTCYHCEEKNKMWIYKPWLDKLNLKMPTTTEEFYQVLKAFKTQDPNGNNKADEIPLMSFNSGAPNSIEIFLMNSFLYADRENKYLDLKDGKIDAVFNKPEFKEGLQYLNRLFSEGLLGAESFTQDVNQLKLLVDNPSVPLVGAVPNNTNPGQTGETGKRWLDYVPVAPLKGPAGVQTTPYAPLGTLVSGAAVITKSSKNPEAAFRWLDAFYSTEILFRSVYGSEGISWAKAGPTEKTVLGQPAEWTRLKTNNVQNDHWAQTSIYWVSLKQRYSESAVNPQTNQEVILYNATKDHYEKYHEKIEHVVPKLYYSLDQSTQIADLDKTINDYVNSMIAKFITGKANLNTEWNTYLDTLNKMNLKKYIEINQAAYDAKKVKK